MAHIFFQMYSDQYYRALGHFVTVFTDIECALQKALWQMSKIKSPVAQAVFAGDRVAVACEKISRISQAENWNEARQGEWKVISDRAAVYRKLRNDILHYGAWWQLDGSWVVTNQDFAHIPSKITETPITITSLTDATADLEKLGLHIFHFLYGPQMSSKAVDSLKPVLERAWRYTQPQQADHQDKTRGSDPKRRRQPRPSSASRRKKALERVTKKSTD